MKIPAPEIRAKVRALKFGESFFLTTKKQVNVAFDEMWRIRPCMEIRDIRANDGKQAGYLMVRTH